MTRDFSQKQYLLFDLDGTLTDSKDGITRSAQYALGQLGIQVEDPQQLVSFVGPPLRDSFLQYGRLSEAQADQAVVWYRERFQKTGMFENSVYNGIPALLAQLRGQGRKLLLATSKPEIFAVRILKHFGLYRFFDFIGGSTLDHSRVRKDDVISYVLRQFPVPVLDDAIMIGDRKHDVLGARACGLECIGVLYGYGSREELDKCHPDGIAESVQALGRMLGAFGKAISAEE